MRSDGTTATVARKSGPDHRDAAQDVREVALGGRPGPDAGDEPALLADDVGLLVGVEGDVDVEEGEGQDQEEVEADVDRGWSA